MDYLAQLIKIECTGYLQTDTGPVCTIADLLRLIRQLLNLAMVTIAPAAFILVVAYGAFLIITSRGSPVQLLKGQRAIGKAFVGLLVVLAAWAIVNTIFWLLGVKTPWYQLPQ